MPLTPEKRRAIEREYRPDDAVWTERQVYNAVRRHLTSDLLDDKWAPGGESYIEGADPRAGYCNVASQAFYWLMGAKSAGYKGMYLKHEGSPHWFVKSPTGKVWDLTAEQFATPVPYGKGRGKYFPVYGYKPSKFSLKLLNRARKDLDRGRRAAKLRSSLVRLAYAQPSTRPLLLPLLKRAPR